MVVHSGLCSYGVNPHRGKLHCRHKVHPTYVSIRVCYFDDKLWGCCALLIELQGDTHTATMQHQQVLETAWVGVCSNLVGHEHV